MCFMYEACTSTSPKEKQMFRRNGNHGNEETNISADILLVFVTIFRIFANV